MKTLYQKLSEENKLKLASDFEKYPALTGRIIETLKNINSWAKFPLGQAVELWSVFEEKKPFDFNAFTELFEN